MISSRRVLKARSLARIDRVYTFIRFLGKKRPIKGIFVYIRFVLVGRGGFILRNVTLAGIDSFNAPQDVRLQAWSRLARVLDLGRLARTTRTVGLADVPTVGGKILDGKVQGRVVVDINA
ncbi:hypothetical protein StoSoilB3_43370 (plasmid) [Arthrobacter sp. StoSoilB3]|nr:hypothetical protein StoSoilB3_43370 [Arthrobacter sp. StoSoilB3]